MNAFSDFSVSPYRHTPSPEEIEKSISFERFITAEMSAFPDFSVSPNDMPNGKKQKKT